MDANFLSNSKVAKHTVLLDYFGTEALYLIESLRSLIITEVLSSLTRVRKLKAHH